MEKMWKKLIEGLRRQQKKQEKEPIKWSEIGLSKIIIMILAGIFLLILSILTLCYNLSSASPPWIFLLF